MVTGWTSQKGDSAVLRVGRKVSAKRWRGQPSVSRLPKRNHAGAHCLAGEHRLQGPGDSGGMEGRVVAGNPLSISQRALRKALTHLTLEKPS